MSPRRGGSAAGPERPPRRRARAAATRADLPASGQPDDLGRTRLSHWRSDGAAKTRFPSEADANRYGLQVRLEHGHDLAAYRCEFCGGWHLGGRGE